jgi:hypothetical protein
MNRLFATAGTPYNVMWQNASSDQAMMSICSYWGRLHEKWLYQHAKSIVLINHHLVITLPILTLAVWCSQPLVHQFPILRVPDFTICGQIVVSPTAAVIAGCQPIGPWTKNCQFQLSSNCSFTMSGSESITNLSSNTMTLWMCQTNCSNKLSSCNYFTFSGTRCVMLATACTPPLPSFTTGSTWGQIVVWIFILFCIHHKWIKQF